MKSLLIIGHTFPEPATTAAGSRMMQLINLFSENDFQITFSSSASASERSVNLEKTGISVSEIALNNKSFDDFIAKLNPSIVLFDRYITEEQFGWRVFEQCPDAVRILDTEDLHFLRKSREVAIKQNIPVDDADLFTEIAKRELASILRSDLSLIISEFEIELLREKFSVSSKILHYLPFLHKNGPKTVQKEQIFEEKVNFITIGNLHHAPNVDSIIYLKNNIWPLIREQLPQVQLHIYGAYAPQRISELHNEKDGFLIKGWANEVDEVMQTAKVCLAPLRFGAGLKGKLIDAMRNGTPSITTPIGAEGINGKLPFPGLIANTAKEIAQASVALYIQKELWMECQRNGQTILKKRFQYDSFSEEFIERITQLNNNLIDHRKENFIGQILQHSSLQSTKYMSRWIEEKNNN